MISIHSWNQIFLQRKITTVGDDIVWLRPGADGNLHAINPEVEGISVSLSAFQNRHRVVIAGNHSCRYFRSMTMILLAIALWIAFYYLGSLITQR